jgi:hypothetical protein
LKVETTTRSFARANDWAYGHVADDTKETMHKAVHELEKRMLNNTIG